MRLTHIFWSLVVLAAIIMLPVLLFLNHGKLQGGPELFGTFVIFWWLIDAATPIALIAAWIRRRPLRENFLFTLLAIMNMYFGIMGIYHLLNTGSVHTYAISFAIFSFNLVWTAIIVCCQFRSKRANQSSL
jgi:hypothetical protein